MPETPVYHKSPPSLLPLYGKALLARQGKSGGNITIPALSASLLGVSTG